MRRALEALVRFYETGEDADRVTYDVAWVEDRNSPVDTINGFVENYLDARGVKGAWEAIVFSVNRGKTESLHRLAEAAAWFEARMPWDPTVAAIRRGRRHRPRNRRHRRNGRGRAAHGDRDQPAERPAHSRDDTAASPCRWPTSTRPTRSPSCQRIASSSAGRPKKSRAPTAGARSRARRRPPFMKSSGTVPAASPTAWTASRSSR